MKDRPQETEQGSQETDQDDVIRITDPPIRINGGSVNIWTKQKLIEHVVSKGSYNYRYELAGFRASEIELKDVRGNPTANPHRPQNNDDFEIDIKGQ
jgi:hypothetical protein